MFDWIMGDVLTTGDAVCLYELSAWAEIGGRVFAHYGI